MEWICEKEGVLDPDELTNSRKMTIAFQAVRQNRTTLEFVTPNRTLRRNKHTQSIQNYTH